MWICGRSVEMHTKRFEAVWKSAGPDRRLCVVITRDPRGRLEDSDFFSTHRNADSREVIEHAADRWSLEACFRDSKHTWGLRGYATAVRVVVSGAITPQTFFALWLWVDSVEQQMTHLRSPLRCNCHRITASTQVGDDDPFVRLYVVWVRCDRNSRVKK